MHHKDPTTHSKLGPFHLNRIYRKDVIAALKALPDESIDLIVTDPPYNIASPGRTTMVSGKPMSTVKAWGHWDMLHPYDYDVFIMHVISECFRVLKPGGALYMFTSREQNGFFIRQAMTRGFTYRNQLVMVKKNPTPSLSKSNWRSAFETCFYVTKGKPAAFNFISQQLCKNVFQYAVPCKESDHPTEKPLALIRQIVEVSSNLNDLVLDPFMGSGTTAVACKEMGRNFLGFELDRSYIKMANERLRKRRSVQRKVA